MNKFHEGSSPLSNNGDEIFISTTGGRAHASTMGTNPASRNVKSLASTDKHLGMQASADQQHYKLY